MFFSLLLGLMACTDAPVTGKVVDASGQAVPSVQVSAVDCSSISDANGEYKLDCKMNKGNISFSKDGFLDHQISFDSSKNPDLRISTQSLIRIPATNGLFVSPQGKYQALTSAVLSRTMSHDGKTVERTYCLQSGPTKPTLVDSGEVAIFDHQATSWRLFRLDSNRCAYSDTRNASGRWVVGYRDKPTGQIETLSETLSIHKLRLTPGHYFAAHWQGFFVPTQPGETTYSGHWIQVEG